MKIGVFDADLLETHRSIQEEMADVYTVLDQAYRERRGGTEMTGMYLVENGVVINEGDEIKVAEGVIGKVMRIDFDLDVRGAWLTFETITDLSRELVVDLYCRAHKVIGGKGCYLYHAYQLEKIQPVDVLHKLAGLEHLEAPEEGRGDVIVIDGRRATVEQMDYTDEDGDDLTYWMSFEPGAETPPACERAIRILYGKRCYRYTISELLDGCSASPEEISKEEQLQLKLEQVGELMQKSSALYTQTNKVQVQLEQVVRDYLDICKQMEAEHQGLKEKVEQQDLKLIQTYAERTVRDILDEEASNEE